MMLPLCGWTVNPLESVEPLENDIDVVGVDLEANEVRHEAIDVDQDALRHGGVTIIDQEASILTARHIFHRYVS